jgi:hypothetical protein
VRRRLSFVAALSLVMAVTALAGCGGGSSGNGVASKSPNEIVAAAKGAADGASAVHVSGSTVTTGAALKFDLSLVAGRGGAGRIAENGLSFELIELEGTIYIKGSPAFYKHFAGAAGAQLLQGKWLKAPATNAGLAGLSSLTELRKLLDVVFAAGNRPLVSLGTSTVSGQAVVGVKDTAKNEKLYVAATGKPFPVELAKSGTGGGTIAFTKWDKPVALKAPANAVDIEKLQKS